MPAQGRGQSSRVIWLEQQPDTPWLSPVRSQEDRTQAGKGRRFKVQAARSQAPSQGLSLSWRTQPEGRGLILGGAGAGGMGCRKELTALRG